MRLAPPPDTPPLPHEVNKSPTHKILVANQRERTTLGRGLLSFHVVLVTNLHCSDIVWSEDLSAYFFYFLPILDLEFSSLFCVFSFSHSFDWEFYPFLLFSSFLFLLLFFSFEQWYDCKGMMIIAQVPPMGLFYPTLLTPDVYPPPPRTWLVDS